MKKKNHVITSLLLIVVLLPAVFPAAAANRYSVASGDWSNMLTWSSVRGGPPGAGVPTAADTVYIDNGFTVSVDISSAICYSLTVGQGISGLLNMGRTTEQPQAQGLTVISNVTVNSGASIVPRRNRQLHTLTIGGNIINNGTMNFTSATVNRSVCNVTLDGSGNQVVGGANPVLFHSLTIMPNSSTSLITAGQTVMGVLLVNGILNTNGNLIIGSNALRTALIDGSGTGQIIGNVTMQRYLASGFGYKYFSSPFQAATVGEFGDDMDLGTAFPSFYRYDENSRYSGWINYTNSGNILSPFTGYAVNFGSAVAPITVDITGLVTDGSISIILYNHDSTYTRGFSLVGNPYPSPIDWNAPGWVKTNIDNALYYFRASTTDQYGGTYSTYINGVSSDGIASNIIPSMQGFFLHVSNGVYPVAGSLGANNNVRINNLTQPFLKSSKATARPLVRVIASFTDDTASVDATVIYFENGALPEFDSDYDALKLMNTDMMVTNIYSVLTDSTKLSVNALTEQTDTAMVIPLGLNTYRDGEVEFKIRDIENLPEGMSLYFRDVVTGSNISLLPDHKYRVTLKAGSYDSRFSLAFLKSVTGIYDHRASDGIFSAYASGGIVKAEVNTLLGGEGTIKIYDLSGRQLYSTKIYESGHYELYPGTGQGIYIISLITGNHKSDVKLILGL